MQSWPNGAKVALSLVVNVEEGSERSVTRGDRGMEPVDELGMVVKDAIPSFPNESNYQFGLKVGAQRVIDLLDAHKLPATWTACGMALESADWLGPAIIARGDEVANHGYRWQFQFRMDEDRERDFIKRSTEAIERTTGVRPRGWLSRYLTTVNTRRLLAEAGYDYHMDDFSGEMPFWDEEALPIAVMPYQLDTNDMKMWSDPAYTARAWGEYVSDSLTFLTQNAQTPCMLSVGLHLRIIGRPGRAAALAQFLAQVSGRDDVWVATRGDILDHFAESHPRP